MVPIFSGTSFIPATRSFTGIKAFGGKRNKKNVQTSLIEEFHYPKYGPGQLWETAASLHRHGGNKDISLHHNLFAAAFIRNALDPAAGSMNLCHLAAFPVSIVSERSFTPCSLRGIRRSCGGDIPGRLLRIGVPSAPRAFPSGRSWKFRRSPGSPPEPIPHTPWTALTIRTQR